MPRRQEICNKLNIKKPTRVTTRTSPKVNEPPMPRVTLTIGGQQAIQLTAESMEWHVTKYDDFSNYSYFDAAFQSKEMQFSISILNNTRPLENGEFKLTTQLIPDYGHLAYFEDADGNAEIGSGTVTYDKVTHLTLVRSSFTFTAHSLKHEVEVHYPVPAPT